MFFASRWTAIRACFLSLTIVLASCSQVRVPNPKTNVELAPAPYFDNKTGIYFPGALGPLFREPAVNLEERSPGLGLAVSYKGKEAQIDVFVYDLQASIIPIGIDAPVIQESFRQAIADLEKAANRKIYSQLQLGRQGVRSFANIDFLYLPFTYAESIAARSGHILVAGVNGQIVKIRASKREGSPIDLERLLAYLGQAISQSQRNGFGGITNANFQQIRENLAAIDLSDGLSPEEAISIAQITLVENDFHNRYNVASASVEEASLPNAALVRFEQYPTEPARYVSTPLFIDVNRDGSATVLPLDQS